MARVLQNALLGLIAERPMSGYELTRTFERTLAHAWSAQHSQIYPELMRLHGAGLIRITEEGPRNRKTYAATPSGVDAVRTWLAESEPDRSSRNEAALRTFLLWLLDETDARRFLLEEVDVHSRRLDSFDRIARENPLEKAANDSEFANRLALEWGLRYERAYVEWARWAVDAVAKRSKKKSWGDQVRQLRARVRRAEKPPARANRAAR